ncbi:replication initiation factor domain-containing protein [Flavobacterium sp. TSSA_36]|uniref:replication initiation factor domain-containing protein n=1 Tax=Flavobacterium sp. TSSA_36 TaxID=3447669 RepID=UPI003F33E502
MHPKTLISIDYLIINLMGDFRPFEASNSSEFDIIKEPFATKTFSDKYLIKYQGQNLATIFSKPRASIINEFLSQLQFENHIFYTKSLDEISDIINLFTTTYCLDFSAINRLDIAFDIHDKNEYYRKLNADLSNGALRVAGRKKGFSSYNEIVKGVCINNGFNFGSRGSSKFLRVYNKSLSLEINEKSYIQEFYKKNDFDNKNVWRFEYQLNASFFTNLKSFGHDKDFFEETGQKLVLPFQDVTYSLFNYSALIQLVIMAQTNFFELRENTGKSQVNKEKSVSFILDFDYLLENIGKYKPTFIRLKRSFVPSLVKRKRLAKALFREYVANFQNVTYIVALNRLLLEKNPFDGTTLQTWFDDKMRFYLSEFQQLEKMGIKFNYALYNEQTNLFIE